MSKSILVTKPKTEKIIGHISQELFGRIQGVQRKLKSLGNDAVFPVDQIIEDALQRATRLAEAELSGRNKQDAPPPVAN